jgi:hypothetical protein
MAEFQQPASAVTNVGRGQFFESARRRLSFKFLRAAIKSGSE